MTNLLRIRTPAVAVIAAFVAALLLVSQASAAPYCSPGEAPQFRFGFAHLKSLIGSVMGEPLECEHYNPENGDSLQQTTTGLSFYRKATNTPTFTDGFRHWAWTSKGLVTWTGTSIDPPGVIVPPTPPPTPARPQAFIDSPVSGVYPLGTQHVVSGSGQSAPGLQIVEYHWDFNGLQLGGNQRFNWSFSTSGTLTLTVRDSLGIASPPVSVSIQVPAATPIPTQRPELIADVLLATDSDCEWNSDLGPTRRLTTFPPHMAEQYCLAAQVNYWPAGWGYYTRWTFADGSSESTNSRTPCPDAECRGGWIRDTWTNPDRYTKPAGSGTVELLVNGILVQTLSFTVVGPDPTAFDPAILAALGLLRPTAMGALIVDTDRGQSVAIAFGDLPVNVHGRYRSAFHSITLATYLQGERSSVVAAVLGHELWHANFTPRYLPGRDGCLKNEIDAFSAEASIWSQLRPAVSLTSFENELDHIYSDWVAGLLPEWVAASPAYQEQCPLAA